MLVVLFITWCGLAVSVDHSSEISKETLIPAPVDCALRAQNGDTVYIEHRGYFRNELMDQNNEGEPLKVVLGKHFILKGGEDIGV